MSIFKKSKKVCDTQIVFRADKELKQRILKYKKEMRKDSPSEKLTMNGILWEAVDSFLKVRDY